MSKKIIIYTDDTYDLDSENIFLSMPYKSVNEFKRENPECEPLVVFELSHLLKQWNVTQLEKENAELKARLAHVESELEKEREVVEFYAEGELSSDLEIRPDKKELWLIPEKWAQRIMSDHYMGKRARKRIKERKEFKYDNNRCH